MCEPNRILMIRPSALGDVARSVTALATLRRGYPDAQIDWLVHSSYVDAVAAHPDLSNIVVFPRNQLRGWFYKPSRWSVLRHFVKSLRQPDYDMVFDLQGLARSGLFSRLTGAGVRVGRADARELGWLGYTHRYPVDGKLHSVERMLAILASHGLEPVRNPQLYLQLRDQQWLDSFLEQHRLTDQPYAVLAPTAQWLSKCWPMDRFALLAQKLLKTQLAGAKVILVAAPHERAYLKPILDACEPDQVLFPTTTVGQMMAIISQARLFVGNDSAPLHIAVGFHRPLVAIYGPSDPAEGGPYQRLNTVVQPENLSAQELASWRKHSFRHYKDDQTLISHIKFDQVWSMVQQQTAATARNR